MEFIELFNINSPEILEFSFSGKWAYPRGIRRKFPMGWHKSEFIITNRRFIIGISNLIMDFKQLFILIIPLEHIRGVSLKKDQFLLEFQTFPDDLSHSDVHTLRIKISEHEELSYKKKNNESLKDAVQYYLSTPEK